MSRGAESMAKPINVKERNIFDEIDLKIMLINEQIKNHRRSIEKTKRECGWNGPSVVRGIDYSEERSKSIHVAFIDGLRMIQLDETRISELEEERKDLQKSKKRIKRIYESLIGYESKVYYYRVIQKMTQVASANEMSISVRQFQRIESDMKEKGLM